MEEIAAVDFGQLRQKMNSLIEQSMLIGKRNSCPQSALYDLSILKDVFEENRGAVFEQIERLSSFQKSVSTKLLLTDGSSLALRTKSSNRKPLESEQTARRDVNRTIDESLGFKENISIMDGKDETCRRGTFEPRPRVKRNKTAHNQSQQISRRTSRQHSNNLS